MQIKSIIFTLLFTINHSYAIEDRTNNVTEFSNSSFNTLDIPIFKKSQGDEGDVAFAVNVHGVIDNGVQQPYQSFEHELEDFDHASIVAENPITNERPFALAFNQEMTRAYGISRTTPWKLIRISPVSGVATEIATFTGVLPNTLLQGIALDKDNKCFIVATDNNNHNTVSTLYECDLETAELTVVGTQSIAPDLHDITASCDGVIYGTDDTQEALYRINKQTGEASLIGSLDLGNDDSFFSMTYDRKSGSIYQYVINSSGHFTAFARLNKDTGKATLVSEAYKFGTFVGASKSTCANFDSFDISPGLNGAWYGPETPGQGFMFDIYPEHNTFFTTWFTFDLAAPESEGASDFGSSQQRWFAAQGILGEGDTVELAIFSNSNGVFDDPTTVQTDTVGTMTVIFEDCSSAVVEYEFDGSELSGVIPIQRVANDNIELCETISE